MTAATSARSAAATVSFSISEATVRTSYGVRFRAFAVLRPIARQRCTNVSICLATRLAALDEGRLAGAALDVLRHEPPPPDHPLLGRDDVLVTPHAAAHTAEARAAMAREAVGELLAVLSGEEPRFAVVPAAAEAGR